MFLGSSVNVRKTDVFFLLIFRPAPACYSPSSLCRWLIFFSAICTLTRWSSSSVFIRVSSSSVNFTSPGSKIFSSFIAFLSIHLLTLFARPFFYADDSAYISNNSNSGLQPSSTCCQVSLSLISNRSILQFPCQHSYSAFPQ